MELFAIFLFALVVASGGGIDVVVVDDGVFIRSISAFTQTKTTLITINGR